MMDPGHGDPWADYPDGWARREMRMVARELRATPKFLLPADLHGCPDCGSPHCVHPGPCPVNKPMDERVT
jgi:hypothetical protein